MEINSSNNNAVHSPYQTRALAAGQADAASAAARKIPGADADAGVTDRVSLSAQAYASAGADDSSDQSDDSTAASSGKAVKAFVYGTLGLERPKTDEQVQEQQLQEQQASTPEQKSDQFYDAGRWLAAAATVGTIVSLLV
jgi:hypothetical protein